jgi:cytoskeletal protein RodZ
MTTQHRITSILSTLLVAGLFSATQLRAQQSNPSTPQQSPQTSQQPQQPADTQPAPSTEAAPSEQSQQPATNPSGTNPGGTSVNPSQAPLQPVTTYPDAAGAQQEQQSPNAAPQTSVPEGPQPKRPSEPVGAATAESVPTAGGAAAKPAGVAIAPAKQHQTRSLLVKIGAVVAAGAALGTVYALSHGTSSTPPGAGMAGVTGR